jgi:hypothetical protein
MAQTRKSKRKPFQWVCAIDRLDGKAPVPCEISNISTGGACISLSCPAFQIPTDIVLLLCGSGTVRRQCTVVWRTRAEIGVQFQKATVHK